MRLKPLALTGVVVWVAGLAVTFVTTDGGQASGSAPRMLETQVPATTLRTVVIEAGDGDVQMTAAAGNAVSVTTPQVLADTN